MGDGFLRQQTPAIRRRGRVGSCVTSNERFVRQPETRSVTRDGAPALDWPMLVHDMRPAWHKRPVNRRWCNNSTGLGLPSAFRSPASSLLRQVPCALFVELGLSFAGFNPVALPSGLGTSPSQPDFIPRSRQGQPTNGSNQFQHVHDLTTMRGSGMLE